MKRIYHSYEQWEDYKCGMYDELKLGKEERKKCAEFLFSNPKECEFWMTEVTVRWKNSCEHFLSNSSFNRIAWLGQSACCLFAGVKENETREVWKTLPPDIQYSANSIAEKVLEKYLLTHS